MDAAEQLPGDGPIDQTDRHFQSTGPVRTQGIGTVIKPGFQVLAYDLQIDWIVIEHVGLRQRHEVQMPVGFPKVLDIANQLRVAIVEQLAETAGRLDAGFRITVPKWRRTKLEIAQRKDVEPASGNAV